MSVSERPTLRERQAPLKTRFQEDPASAQTTLAVHSVTASGDDPTRVRIASGSVPGVVWEVGAHPLAAGEGDLACSGDLLLGALAACQEITIRMVAAAMGITIDHLDLTVTGDLDFRGTMGIDRETPVGFTAIRVNAHIVADAPPDRLQRLVQRAEHYCVVSSTLHQPPALEMNFTVG